MLIETIRLALRAIFRNVLRSFLTVLGVVIGVGSVIAMLTVGQGSSAQVTADVARLGSNLLIVRPGQSQRGPQSVVQTASAFTTRDVDALARQIAGVRAVAPASSRSVRVIAGNINRSTTVTGTDNRYLEAREMPVAAGRPFLDGEVRTGAAVCLLGQTVRRELFGRGEPIGQNMRVGTVSCRVIGVIEAQGVSSFGTDQDDFVLMPLRTFQRRIAGNTDVAMMFAAVREGVSTDRARDDIERLMRERRRVGPGMDDDFNVFDMTQVAAVLTSTTNVLTGLLAAVAAVSLLVGGIGIMNIMLASVTERTREIGVRRAIGAKRRQIVSQFLIETVVLSSAGGFLGIAIGVAIPWMVTVMAGMPTVVTAYSLLLSVGISLGVGLLFGIYPAARAANLDPIVALRHE